MAIGILWTSHRMTVTSLLLLHECKSRSFTGRNVTDGRPDGRPDIRLHHATMTHMTQKPATVKMILCRAVVLSMPRYDHTLGTFRNGFLSMARFISQDGVPLHIDGPETVRVEQAGTQVAAGHIALTDPEALVGDVTPAVALGSKRKAESDVPINPTEPAFSNDDAHPVGEKRIPHAAIGEERAMSPLSELTESESDAQHPMDVTTPGNNPDFGTPLNENGRPTRLASNKPRLTELMRDMNAYEKERRKGMSGSDYETHVLPFGTARVPPLQTARRSTPRPQMAYRSSSFPKKKPRYSKKMPSESVTPTGTPSTPNGATSGPSSGTLLYIPPDPAAVSPSASLSATHAKSKKVTAKKPKLRTAKKPRVRTNVDLPSRPSKRSRGEDSLGVVNTQASSIDGSSIGQPSFTNIADSQRPAGDVGKVRISSPKVHAVLEANTMPP